MFMKLKNSISINTLLKEYEDKNVFNDAQLCNIKLGLIMGDEVSIYAKPEFNYKQMDAIASGMIHNIDVTKYADHRYSYLQMLAIKDALIEDIDVTPYITFDTAPMTIRLFAKSLRLEKQS